MQSQGNSASDRATEAGRSVDERVRADLLAVISNWQGEGWPTNEEIAQQLNGRGSTTRTGLPWSARLVKYTMMDYGIRKMDLRPAGSER